MSLGHHFVAIGGIGVLVPCLALAGQAKLKAPTVDTSKGILPVRGELFLDGRDLEAQPAVTVMQINVWDSPERGRRLCRAAHGTKVTIREVERNNAEGRYYFRVFVTPKCEGWLPEVFLSKEKHAPIGTRQR